MKKAKKKVEKPKKKALYYVPVVNMKQEPLMPTNIFRAKRWIATRKATPFWKKGIFCVRLNVPTQENKQEIKQEMAVGVDPGSKREGYTIKSASTTYLNVQCDAEAAKGIQGKVEDRRNMRRARRQRNTPYRKCRSNRKGRGIPPSTKARWQLKLNTLNWLKKIFPITATVVEDIAAATKPSKKRWNQSFSPLEVGKKWFYNQVSPTLKTMQGWETANLRNSLGLKKSTNKLSDSWDAHCVDSWVLAYSAVGGMKQPDNKQILYIKPIKMYRRQLHKFQPTKGGKRYVFGGTRSCGFKKGSIVEHKDIGIAYVGGSSKGRISLHDLRTGERLGRNYKPEDCRFRCYNSYLYR